MARELSVEPDASVRSATADASARPVDLHRHPPPIERVSYAQSRALPGVEVLVAYDSAHHWRVFHERYAFCACRAAAAAWRYRGKEHPLGDEGIMLLEPGECHRTVNVRKAADFTVMHVPAICFEEAARELGVHVTTHFRFAQTQDPRLFRAIYGFSRAVETQATPLEQQSWFNVCVALLLKYAEHPLPVRDPGCARDAVERAKAYLQQHFNEPVTLGELAAEASMSRFHLVRSFTRHVGIPPHTYQIDVRIAHARAMLAAGAPASRVAADVGFADQSHLTRHFKKLWRKTPGDYARSAVA